MSSIIYQLVIPIFVSLFKEKRGYVALDYDAELSKRGKLSTEYELPDCEWFIN